MIFPLACTPVAVVVDGSPVRSYQPAFVLRGRVLAPVNPYVVAVAASVEYDGQTIVVRRGDRFAQIAAARYVELAPLLRTLGLNLSYDKRNRVVVLQTPPPVEATPTPFNPAVPSAPPAAVFTPVPETTPKPVVTGKPSPRRTPLPLSVPQSQPSP